MSLQPIGQGELVAQLRILVEASERSTTLGSISVDQIAFALARFAEAHAISEGNRQIEALKPKNPVLLPPYDLDESDARQMRLKLRSALFDYFLWFCPPETSGVVVAILADEALLDVERRLASHQQKEGVDEGQLDE